jgi:hypothetical protein
MERWIGQDHGGKVRRLEGFIGAHDGFRGWANKQHTRAYILLDGWLCELTKQEHTKSESGQCSVGCKKADPMTFCHCICEGANHGLEYEGPHHELDDVAEVIDEPLEA